MRSGLATGGHNKETVQETPENARLVILRNSTE